MPPLQCYCSTKVDDDADDDDDAKDDVADADDDDDCDADKAGSAMWKRQFITSHAPTPPHLPAAVPSPSPSPSSPSSIFILKQEVRKPIYKNFCYPCK